MYDTIYCIEYSYLVLNTIYFARSKFCPSEAAKAVKVWRQREGSSVRSNATEEVPDMIAHEPTTHTGRDPPASTQLEAREGSGTIVSPERTSATAPKSSSLLVFFKSCAVPSSTCV